MTKLLTTSGNPKTDKGAKYGYATAILHLAPADLSGFNTCAAATAGCRAACLNTAGHGGIAKGGLLTYESIKAGRSNATQAARVWRTRFLFEDRQGFLRQLHKEITAFVKRVEREGLTPVVRLNGTSDIRWEAGAFHLDGRSIFEHFPTIRFYDYTKLSNRKNLPANYSVTFSYADGNHDKAVAALANGLNVAAVFRSPEARDAYRDNGGFLGVPVIDGDDSDLRFLDPKGVVVGLYAKGQAKRDTSGFVVDYVADLRLAA
jgi:hypothetical protein